MAETEMNRPGKAGTVEFDAMNLQVGVKLQLLTHRNIKPVPYFSTLIGYVKDEYILVRIPFENGMPVSLFEGEKLTVRVFSGTNVCTFVSTADRIFLQPYFYAHLSFPHSIQGASLRVAMRVKVNIAGQVGEDVDDGKGAGRPVTLRNLSVGGALLESEQEIGECGAEFDLVFPLVSRAGAAPVQIRTRACIRNFNRPEAAGGELHAVYAYGVQFIELDPIHQIMLQNLTYETLLGSRQNIV